MLWGPLIAMGVMGALKAAEEQQQAKALGTAESEVSRWGPLTGMQGRTVTQPGSRSSRRMS